MQKRSISAVIIFTLISCGIYGIYWVYKTAAEVEAEVGAGKFSASVLAILCLFTGIIGYILYGISMNESLNKVREAKGMEPVDNQLIYILLGFFIPIALIGVVQNDINKLADE